VHPVKGLNVVARSESEMGVAVR
jgi:hypothetical protein